MHVDACAQTHTQWMIVTQISWQDPFQLPANYHPGKRLYSDIVIDTKKRHIFAVNARQNMSVSLWNYLKSAT